MGVARKGGKKAKKPRTRHYHPHFGRKDAHVAKATNGRFVTVAALEQHRKEVTGKPEAAAAMRTAWKESPRKRAA